MQTFADTTVTSYEGSVSILYQQLAKKLRNVRKQYKLLAAGAVSKDVFIYDLDEKKEHVIEVQGPVYTIKIIDDHRIAFGRDNIIVIHQLKDNEDDLSLFTMNSYGKQLFTLIGHTSMV